MGKKLLSSLILTLAFNAAAIGNADARRPATPVYAPPQAALVVEADTNHVLFEQDPDKKVHPASLTKLMTLYLTFEALDKGTLELDVQLPVSTLASWQARSHLGLKKGQKITVEQCILAIVTNSANDATVVLAEGIGGNEENFIKMMNAKARKLGMNDTRFTNPNGLPSPQQLTTARDMVTLSEAHLQTFPQYQKYFKTKAFVFNGKTYPAHNKLMKKMPEIDFGKTGFVNASGFNLVVSAKRGDERLVGVVFGGVTASARDKKMAGLLDNGFAKAAAAKHHVPARPSKPAPPPPAS